MLSCLPVSIFGDICAGKMSVAQWSCLAKEMGLDAFDITISFLRDRTPAGLKAMREQINAGGLPCMSMSIYSDLTDMGENAFEKELLRAQSDIACAADMGVNIVRVTAGQFHGEYDINAQFNQAMNGIKEVKKIADKFGVGLTWENHSKPGAWENPDFNYNPERVDMMFEALKGSGVGMNYDVANAYLIGRGAEFLEKSYGEVKSVHLNDVASVNPLKFAGVFSGLVPIEESLEVLAKKGFGGIISVEEASFEGTEGIKKYMAKTKEMLKKYDLL